jgi:hypothetical protein
MKPPSIVELAKSLHPIDPQLLNPSKNPGAQRLWYQGGEPYFDLFAELTEEQIIWLEITLRGKCLSWQNQQWQTGITNEMNDYSMLPTSKLVRSDPVLDQEFLALIRQIIQVRSDEPFFQRLLALFN